MPTSQTFMSSRKCGAMDLERDCWRKRYHGAAPGGPMRSFYGRLPEADLFIAAAVWLSLQIFSNCDTLRVCRARPARQNCSRHSFGRSNHDYGNALQISWCDCVVIFVYDWESFSQFLNHVDYAGRLAALCCRPQSFQAHDAEILLSTDSALFRLTRSVRPLALRT